MPKEEECINRKSLEESICLSLKKWKFKNQLICKKKGHLMKFLQGKKQITPAIAQTKTKETSS